MKETRIGLIIHGKIKDNGPDKPTVFIFEFMFDDLKWAVWSKENEDILPGVFNHMGMGVVVHDKKDKKGFNIDFFIESEDNEDIYLPIKHDSVTFSVFRDPLNDEEWHVQLEDAPQAAQTV